MRLQPRQSATRFDVIPAGTIAELQMTIRPGNAGEGGLLRRSKNGNSEALDCEFIVTDGPYAKRKVWRLFTVGGTTEGHAAPPKSAARNCAPSSKVRAASDRTTPARRQSGLGKSRAIETSTGCASSAVSGSRRRATIIRPKTSCSTPSRRIGKTGIPSSRRQRPATRRAGTAAKAEPAKIARPAWAK